MINSEETLCLKIITAIMSYLKMFSIVAKCDVIVAEKPMQV